MVRVSMTKLGKLDPVPAQVCTVECQRMQEREFEGSGAWGFGGGFKITKTDFEESEGRLLFDNFPILGGVEGATQRQRHDEEPSGAIFRFSQAYEALTGDELEGDLEYDSDENQWYMGEEQIELEVVKQAYRDLAQQMIGFDNSIEVSVEKGEGQYEGQDRNRIDKWL